MPARGDHDQRRRDVARIAADLVATGGLAAATHRRIAEASGASTTVVSHYFTDKHDLVKTTYTEVGDRVTARLHAAADSTDRCRPSWKRSSPSTRTASATGGCCSPSSARPPPTPN